MEATKDPKRKLTYREYVVAVLDVLGQREAIRDLADAPPGIADESETTRKLKASLSVRNGVRDIIKSAFEAVTRQHDHARFAMLSHEQRALFDRVHHHRAIKTYGFGDTVVAYAAVDTPEGDPSVRDIWGILYGCALAMFLSIAAGHPIRGAIELGFGLEPEENEVYGPAFLAAYELEQHVAQHPRIVVGDALASYLQKLPAGPGNSTIGGLITQLASTCLKLIARDEDGCAVVDYLADSACAIAATENAELFDKGLEFARREHARFVAQRNSKLAARYAALVRYYQARASTWQKSPT